MARRSNGTQAAAALISHHCLHCISQLGWSYWQGQASFYLSIPGIVSSLSLANMVNIVIYVAAHFVVIATVIDSLFFLAAIGLIILVDVLIAKFAKKTPPQQSWLLRWSIIFGRLSIFSLLGVLAASLSKNVISHFATGAVLFVFVCLPLPGVILTCSRSQWELSFTEKQGTKMLFGRYLWVLLCSPRFSLTLR